MSAVLAVDTFATGAPCVDALLRQTMASRLELVLVGPRLDVPRGSVSGFGGMQVIDSEIRPHTSARARGMLAATAPYVYVAEVHAFPEPQCLELMTVTLDEGAAAVMPRLRNANPETACSWASLFATYGAFTGDAAYEPRAVPLHNGAFRRDVLQRVAREEPEELVYGVGLSRILRAEGRRMVYVPKAVVRHLNVATPRAMIADRLVTSRLWASMRARPWSRARRFLYTAGSPLIPVAFLARVLQSDGWRRHRDELPRGTLTVLAVSTIPIALGELLGYVAGPGDAADRHLPLELHRTDYV